MVLRVALFICFLPELYVLFTSESHTGFVSGSLAFWYFFLYILSLLSDSAV
jgi:hypothetical protein